MSDHLLTFELSKDKDELFVHGDAQGLRFLAKNLIQLADHADLGQYDHTHLMTEDWGGLELSNISQSQDSSLLNHVKLYGWPKQ